MLYFRGFEFSQIIDAEKDMQVKRYLNSKEQLKVDIKCNSHRAASKGNLLKNTIRHTLKL